MVACPDRLRVKRNHVKFTVNNREIKNEGIIRHTFCAQRFADSMISSVQSSMKSDEYR